MNKIELVTKMAEKSNLTKKEAALALDAFIERVEEALENGDKVQLIGFGTFASTVPVFKAGKEFKDRVK